MRNILLTCGILCSLLYVAADILAALRWGGYSYASQAVSELMAVGAPTRPFMITSFTVYGGLVIAFGIGVCMAAGRKRSLLITGILLTAYGAIGEAGLLWFPMHLRGAANSFTDTMHIIDTGLLVLLTLMFIGFGASADERWFRIYSIGTILILLVFGILAAMDGPRVAAQLPTPWLGVKERVNIYASMLWVLVFAVLLLRSQKSNGASGGP